MEQKQTFEKRAGTTDRGTDYEHLYIAHLILKMALDDRVENFYLSSNDKLYGSFDDVVLMIKYYDEEEVQVYAIQLKQSKNKVIRPNDLTATKGNFSISHYLQDYNENLKNLHGSVKMILYTNRKAQLPNEIELDFKEEKFNAEIINDVQNDLLVTSQQGVCYTFGTKNKYESFFRNFFVYSNQADVDQIEQKTLKFFQNNFNSDESVFKDFVNFITKWSMKEGNKEKLDKVWMQQAIVIRVLSPFIKPLSFTEEVSNKAKTFREAVSKFPVTILHKDNYEKIKNLWEDIKIEEIAEVNKIITKFQIRSEKITHEEDLKKEDKEMSKLLWLLGKCPLIVKDYPLVYKLARLCEKNFIFLTSTESLFPENEDYFKNLSQLKKEKRLYANILDNFTFSLEGQKHSHLKVLIQLDENFTNMITTDKLVQMLDGPLIIGTQKEILLSYHITRNLSQILIHPQFLEQLEDILILISKVENITTFQETLKDVEIIEVKKGTKVEPRVTRGKVIYVSRNEYSQEDFDNFCAENRGKLKCHEMRYLNSQCLEWIRSKSGVEDLEKFQLNQKYTKHTIHESSLLGNLENSVNLVCANSGMGKSTLMKSLKSNSSSSVWTVLIYVRNHALQLRQKEADKFLEYLLAESCKGCDEMDQEIFKRFVESDKVRLIWDGLDEVSDESLEDILNVINVLSKKGIKQWVTSRNNLKRVLEGSFKTLSREIQHFSIKEQRVYIRKRLDISDDELYGIFIKIKTNIQPFSNSDILGIPLQIYMLTELVCRNKEKYSDLFTEIFTMLDLYEHFVEEKFNLYYTEKIKSDLSIEKNYQKYREEMNLRINFYKKIAFNLYVKTSSINDSFLEEIRKFGDSVGFISTVSRENVPEFSHNSFGEYFAALHLFDTNPQKSKDRKFISDEKSNNIRFFLDLMLSQDSKAHIAILYKNSVLLDKCGEDDLNCKDKIGRCTLEVACAWSKNYKVLDLKENTQGQFDFQHKYIRDDSNTQLLFKDVSKSFDQIGKTDIRVKRLMLLLPSFIPLYDRKYHCFDEKTAASILYYSVKFDYVIIFKYVEKIYWLQYTYENFEIKCLLSFAMTCKSRQVLEEIVANKQNRDMLSKNLYIILATCKPEYNEVFSLLIKNAVDINELIYLACWGGSAENVEFLIRKGVKVHADACDRMPIHYACDNENFGLQIVKLLVSSKCEVNVADVDNQTPLHYACMNSNGFKIVDYLINKGAEIDALDVDRRAPIHYACDNEDDGKRIVELLIAKGAKLNVPDVNDRMPVHYACMNWKYGFYIVEFLMNQDVEVNVGDERGRMPVHFACRNYVFGFRIAELMISKGVDVNVTDRFGRTPIHYACESGKTKTVQLLISSGAKIDVEDVDGLTPVHCACKNFSHGYHTLKLLVDLVDINVLDAYHRTPTHYACENGKIETVRLLLDKGAKIDTPDVNGRLPIHFACENNDYGYNIVQYLVYKGTNVDACDAKGKTAMHCACETGNVYVVKFLINQKAKIDVADKKGKLPIHYACMNWNFGYEIVRLLDDVGAGLQVRDVKGRMPIHYACKAGNVMTVGFLIERGASVDVRDNQGRLPCEFAQKARNFNIVRFLNVKKN